MNADRKTDRRFAGLHIYKCKWNRSKWSSGASREFESDDFSLSLSLSVSQLKRRSVGQLLLRLRVATSQIDPARVALVAQRPCPKHIHSNQLWNQLFECAVAKVKAGWNTNKNQQTLSMVMILGDFIPFGVIYTNDCQKWNHSIRVGSFPFKLYRVTNARSLLAHVPHRPDVVHPGLLEQQTIDSSKSSVPPVAPTIYHRGTRFSYLIDWPGACLYFTQ